MNHEAKLAWHGAGADIVFEPADFEIVDLVLGQVPELRICALALKRAKAKGLTFPIKTADSLSEVLVGKGFEGGGHRFGSAEVRRFMPDEFFPILDEGELVSRIYVALIRCRHEDAQEVQRSAEVLRSQQVMSELKEAL